jgi:hypothetical protein
MTIEHMKSLMFWRKPKSKSGPKSSTETTPKGDQRMDSPVAVPDQTRPNVASSSHFKPDPVEKHGQRSIKIMCSQ